jgi:hypothetical protein
LFHHRDLARGFQLEHRRYVPAAVPVSDELNLSAKHDQPGVEFDLDDENYISPMDGTGDGSANKQCHHGQFEPIGVRNPRRL